MPAASSQGPLQLCLSPWSLGRVMVGGTHYLETGKNSKEGQRVVTAFKVDHKLPSVRKSES